MSTPDYVLTQDHSYPSEGGGWDKQTLPAGTWVRPIDVYYIPKFIRDDKRWRDFDSNTEIFCYTRFGIVPIPRKYVVRR